MAQTIPPPSLLHPLFDPDVLAQAAIERAERQAVEEWQVAEERMARLEVKIDAIEGLVRHLINVIDEIGR